MTVFCAVPRRVRSPALGEPERLFPFMTRLVFFLVLLGSLHCLAQEEKYLLRLHWEPGKLYLQETSTDTSTRKTAEVTETQTMRVIQTTELRVKQKKGSSDKLVDVLFTRVKGEIAANGKTLTFDSNKPNEQNPMLQEAFGRTVGKSFTLVYDGNDRFRSISNIASMASEPGAVVGLSAVADSHDVASLFRKSMEMGLPPVPVGLGDTWSADETINFPKAGEVRVQMNGRLQSIESRDGRKHAKIAFEGKFGNTAGRADKPASLVEISNDSSMAGILFYDLERKTISFGAYTTSIKLEAPGETLPFEQKVTSRLVGIEDLPKK